MPALVLALAGAPSLFAQTAAPGTAAPQAGPAAKRPTVAVMDFDYGALANWWGQYDIGHGIATQLVYALLDAGSMRIIERSRLATVLGEQDFAATERASPEASKLARVGHALGVRYVVAGSVTRFATSDRKFGGGVGGTVATGLLGPVGGLTFRKAKQEVSITARVIDTTTGEVVLSAVGNGVAKKGHGVGFESRYGSGEGVAASTQPEDFKAAGMGAAQELAVTELAGALLAQVDKLSTDVPAPEPAPTPTPDPTPTPKPARKPAPKPPAAKVTQAPAAGGPAPRPDQNE
jgi:curli biogenesis system outer membrane secretion channel CsgG